MEGQGAQAQRVINSSFVNTPAADYVGIFRNDSDGKYYGKLSNGTIEAIAGSIGTGDWAFNGNTVLSEKWLGTIDNFDLPFKVNNVEAGRFQAIDGSFHIGNVNVGPGPAQLNVLTSTLSAAGQFENDLISAGVHYGIYSLALGAGGGSNIAGYFNAAGGASNISGYFDNGDVILINGGEYINTAVDPTSKFSLKSSGTSIASYAIRLYNNTPFEIFSVYSSAQIKAGDSVKNLFIGKNCGISIDTVGGGIENVGIGVEVLQNLTTGVENTAMGYFSQNKTTTALYNASYGAGSLESLTTGNQNTSIGSHTLQFCILGAENTAVGNGALNKNTTDQNTAIGAASLQNNTTGSENVGLGWGSLYSNLVGSEKTSLGYRTLFFSTGDNNTAIGARSQQSTSTGSDNTTLGVYSGYAITVGSGNVFLGAQTGFFETGSNKLFIDNTRRASEADARLKALIYGVFDAAIVNQKLYFNAATINVLNLPTGNAGLASGDLYVDSAANILANGDLVVGRKA